MNALAIITARGGSKGVPRKNIRPLCGKPLLQYTAEAALAARQLSRVILSTEDEEIAAVGRACGLDVPFVRPADLAQDDTPTLPVMQHAVRWLESNGARFDFICLLQPTNPFRDAAVIDGCLEMLVAGELDSVVTILPVPTEYNPHWVYELAQDGTLRLSTGEASPLPRRQLLPPAFHREGSVYAMRRDLLMEENTLFGSKVGGYLMNREGSINIDTDQDWIQAEQMLGSQPEIELTLVAR
jgi:CMP-N-acetylneuraminic acid synthetase